MPEKTEIEVLCEIDGEIEGRPVQALIYGVFAIHRTVMQYSISDHLWSVTHIPTGYSLFRAIPYKKQAIDFVADLLAAGIDLKDIDPEALVEEHFQWTIMKPIALKHWRIMQRKGPDEYPAGWIHGDDEADAAELGGDGA